MCLNKDTGKHCSPYTKEQEAVTQNDTFYGVFLLLKVDYKFNQQPHNDT